jgi:hypothetical protein
MAEEAKFIQIISCGSSYYTRLFALDETGIVWEYACAAGERHGLETFVDRQAGAS